MASQSGVVWLWQLDVAGPQQLVGPGPSAPTLGRTKDGIQVLRVGHKRFFFDLGTNLKGEFLKITEVRHSLTPPPQHSTLLGLTVAKLVSVLLMWGPDCRRWAQTACPSSCPALPWSFSTPPSWNV